MTLNEARTLANINTRSQTLAEAGYTFQPAPEFPSVFFVFKPGSDISDYAVDLAAPFCTCPAFEKHNECKHHLFVKREEEAREAAQVERLEREHEEAYYLY